MFKTTSRISSQEPPSRRFTFSLFSLLRYIKNILDGIIPTADPQNTIQVPDNPTLTSQIKKKEFFLFRIIEFLFFRITSILESISSGVVKTIKIILSPLRRIGTFLFEKILDLAEFIYTFVLDPFRDRFGYLLQGTLMVIKSKPVSIALFFIISTFLARMFLVNDPRHILIFSLIPFFMLMIFFYPIIGMCAYLMFGLGMLHKMIWNFPSMYTGSPLIVVSVIAYAFRIIVGKEKEFCWVQDNQNLIILALWSIMTLGYLQFPIKYSLYYYLASATWFVTYFLAVQIIGSNKQRLLFYLFTLCLIYGIYAFKTGRNVLYYGIDTSYEITAEIKGRMEDNNELAACLNMSLPLILGFSLITKKKMLKYALLITSITTAFMVIYTKSRGALLGFSVLLLPLIFKLVLRNKKIRKKGITIIIIIAIIGSAVTGEKITHGWKSISGWKNVATAKNRVIGAITGFRAMMDKPLHGIGAGRMISKFKKYCPDVITIRYWFGKDGTLTLHKPGEEKGIRTFGIEAHNAYAAVGGEQGVFVLFLWVFLLIYSIWQLRAIRRILPKIPENEWAHILSHAIELSILSYMITANFLNNFSEGFLYMLLAAALSLRHIALRQKQSIEIASALWLFVLFSLWTYYTFIMRLAFIRAFI
jgi:probable O-glycosylation ligase (exosortase A-associated)